MTNIGIWRRGGIRPQPATAINIAACMCTCIAVGKFATHSLLRLSVFLRNEARHQPIRGEVECVVDGAPCGLDAVPLGPPDNRAELLLSRWTKVFDINARYGSLCL